MEAVPIARAAEGATVLIKGRASECALTLIRAFEQRQLGHEVTWVAVAEELNFGGVILRDDTGKAAVTAGSVVRLAADGLQASSVVHEDVPAGLEALLRRHGKSSHGGFYKKRMRFDEASVQEGEELWAYGLARWEPDPSPDPGRSGVGYRAMAQRLALRATPAQPVLLASSRAAIEAMLGGRS
jgi:hypothetical protein